MILKREIISSYSLLEILRKRYPKRKIEPDSHVEQGSFYFFRPRDGSVRLGKMDGSIWACDYERGFPYMKKIWPRSTQSLSKGTSS